MKEIFLEGKIQAGDILKVYPMAGQRLGFFGSLIVRFSRHKGQPREYVALHDGVLDMQARWHGEGWQVIEAKSDVNRVVDNNIEVYKHKRIAIFRWNDTKGHPVSAETGQLIADIARSYKDDEYDMIGAKSTVLPFYRQNPRKEYCTEVITGAIDELRKHKCDVKAVWDGRRTPNEMQFHPECATLISYIGIWEGR